jgi:hypothetical protein
LLLFIRPAEGGLEAFCFYFGLLVWRFLGLWLLAFWCGELWEGKRITDGKRIAKEGLIESLH